MQVFSFVLFIVQTDGNLLIVIVLNDVRHLKKGADPVFIYI